MNDSKKEIYVQLAMIFLIISLIMLIWGIFFIIGIDILSMISLFLGFKVLEKYVSIGIHIVIFILSLWLFFKCLSKIKKINQKRNTI